MCAEVEDVVAEQNLKNLRRDEDKEKAAAEEKRKKGEQRTLSLNVWGIAYAIDVLSRY